MRHMRPMIGRWTLSACHAVAARRRVGCSAFLLFQRDECHSALRTITGMIGYNFGMHRARVLLRVSLLMLLLDLVLDERAIGVNRPYLRTRYERDQRNCARDDS